jgi:hypothetical protein
MDLVAIAAATTFLLVDMHAKIQSLLNETGPHTALIRGAKVFTAITTIIVIARILGHLTTIMLNRDDEQRPPRDTCFIYTHIANYSGDRQSACTVCLCEGSNDIRLQCGHSFHWACVRPWLDMKNTCPLCKKSQARLQLDSKGIVVGIF